MEKRKQIEWIQYARAFCIIAVIFIHCKSAEEYRVLEGTNIVYWAWMLIRNFLDFPVGLFFVISGYLVNEKNVLCDTKTFLKKRLIRLGLPFLIWTVFYSCVYIYMEWPDFTVQELISKALRGNVAVHLYFVLVLLQLNIITPFVIKMKQSRIFNIFFWMITPVFYIVNFVYFVNHGDQMPSEQLYFMSWFIYYYFGLKLKDMEQKYASSKALSCGLVILGFAAFLESLFLIRFGATTNYAVSQMRLFVIPYILSSAVLLCNRKIEIGNAISKALNSIGEKSYGIYYVHVAFLYCINKAYLIFQEKWGAVPLFLLIGIELILTTVLSYLTCCMCEKILGKKFASKFFGM